MKFAIITDIHIGNYRPEKGIYRKVTPLAPKLLKNFVLKMNTSFHPDFVVQGGDLIEDTTREIDIQNMKKGIAILSELNCPVYHLVGNHELRCLTTGDIKKLLGYKQLYFSFDKNDFRFLFLFTEQPYPGKVIRLESTQILWLRKKLHTDKKIVIFSHHSLVPVNTRGNFWFSGRPEVTFINNHEEFLRAISKNNVKLVLNGHLHWNRKKIIQGVPFITTQSLVENVSKNIEGPPANAFVLVTIDHNDVFIQIKGLGGRKYKIKL